MVEHDCRQRILQLRATADRAVAQLPPDQLAQLEAYARGVNAFIEPDEKPIETLTIDEGVEKEQVARLKAIKARRDGEAANRCRAEVRRGAATKENLMPALLEAARARCTVGEIMAALADVFGRYDGAAKW